MEMTYQVKIYISNLTAKIFLNHPPLCVVSLHNLH